MSEPHIPDQVLSGFGNDDLSNHDALEMLWHVFVCDVCREQAGRPVGDCADQLFGDSQPIGREIYATVVQRVIRAARKHYRQRRDRPSADDRATLLLGHPQQRRRLLVRNHRGFADLDLAEALLANCRRSWTTSPRDSEQVAELALEIADQIIVHETAHQALVADLRARAWSYVANCRRIRSDLREVEGAFCEAYSWLERGTGDILETAALYNLESSFLRASRRLTEAAARLDSALDLYRAANDPHLEGRALINRAFLAAEMDRRDDAIELLEQAAEKIDLRREPALAFQLKHNLVVLLTETGRLSEATSLLPEARRLAELYGGRLDRLRLVWSEGLITNQLGERNEALITLECVRDAFVDEGIGYDAALVSLDLARLHLEAGETADARRIAQEILPIFASRDVHREAIAALTLFRQALERETATVELVDRVGSFLRQARNQPALRFDPQPN